MMNKKFLPLVLVSIIASLACTISINGAGETAPADEISVAEAVAGTQTAAAPAELPPGEVNPEVTPANAPEENSSQPPAQGDADLAIWQTLLRYDGQLPQGTFEITVCNLGVESAPPFEADLTANNVTRRLAAAQPLGQYECVGLYDPGSNFETFGVTQPGKVSVSAALYPASPGDPPQNNTSHQEVALPSIGPISDDSMMHLYQECRKTSPHENCLLYLSQDPPADPHMIKKQSGPVIVLAPADYHFLAEEYLAGNALCTEKLQAYMGFPPPHPITQHLLIGEDGMGSSHAGEIGIMTIVPAESFGDLVGYLPDNWKATLTGVCRNEHEMTHLFLGDVPLPSWLNEGLATYLEGGQRVTPELEGPLECRENGWYGNDWDDGQNKEMPYMNLVGAMDPDVHRYQYYYTASCFWDYLESNYGHEKFQQVLQKLVSYRDPVYNYCGDETLSTYFMRDIVRPVIGDDITPVTQARWGFGETYTGCEP